MFNESIGALLHYSFSLVINELLQCAFMDDLCLYDFFVVYDLQ